MGGCGVHQCTNTIVLHPDNVLPDYLHCITTVLSCSTSVVVGQYKALARQVPYFFE